jgi:hypothetical protein
MSRDVVCWLLVRNLIARRRFPDTSQLAVRLLHQMIHTFGSLHLSASHVEERMSVASRAS